MKALLLGYHGHQILNADVSSLYPFRNRGKIVINRGMLNIATWKEKDCKKEWHSSPSYNSFKNSDYRRHLFWTASVLNGQSNHWKSKKKKFKSNLWFYELAIVTKKTIWAISLWKMWDFSISGNFIVHYPKSSGLEKKVTLALKHYKK